MSDARLQAVAPVLLFVVVFAVVMIVVSFRRAAAIRRRLIDLTEEHHRLEVYVRARLAGQKAHARAEEAEGDERIAHLRDAITAFRQAQSVRPPEDAAGYESLRSAIELAESDLRAMGVEPE